MAIFCFEMDTIFVNTLNVVVGILKFSKKTQCNEVFTLLFW